VGKIGHDELGSFFAQELENQKTRLHLLYSTSQDTGTALSLITPDSERTFATYLGAAVELGADDLQSSFFEDFTLLHLEGYLVYNHQLIEESIRRAKERNMEISIDLASYNVVEANRDFLTKIIKDSVDIVFANEMEAKALTGYEPEKALDILSEYCKVAVVKVGAKGSWIKVGNVKTFIEALKVKAIDTTGAGDLYASGSMRQVGFISGKSCNSGNRG
jgi:sugar/nucleoside kinase (ribokinase family)